MGKIICFTGHREIPEKDCSRLQDALYATLEKQIQSGADTFRAGGALGFDTLAALTVLLLRRSYPHIRLELILPCPTQTRGWRKSDICLYDQILEQANSHRYISQHYFNGVLQIRNLALVENADICVAYLHSSHGGGTAFTVTHALKNGLELINLNDLLS